MFLNILKSLFLITVFCSFPGYYWFYNIPTIGVAFLLSGSLVIFILGIFQIPVTRQIRSEKSTKSYYAMLFFQLSGIIASLIVFHAAILAGIIILNIMILVEIILFPLNLRENHVLALGDDSKSKLFMGGLLFYYFYEGWDVAYWPVHGSLNKDFYARYGILFRPFAWDFETDSGVNYTATFFPRFNLESVIKGTGFQFNEQPSVFFDYFGTILRSSLSRIKYPTKERNFSSWRVFVMKSSALKVNTFNIGYIIEDVKIEWKEDIYFFD